MSTSSELSAMDTIELQILYISIMGLRSQIKKQLQARQKLLPILKSYFNDKAKSLTKHQKPNISISVLRLSFDYNSRADIQS